MAITGALFSVTVGFDGKWKFFFRMLLSMMIPVVNMSLIIPDERLNNCNVDGQEWLI